MTKHEERLRKQLKRRQEINSFGNVQFLIFVFNVLTFGIFQGDGNKKEISKTVGLTLFIILGIVLLIYGVLVLTNKNEY